MVRCTAKKKPIALRVEAATIWKAQNSGPLWQRKQAAAAEFRRKFPGAVTRPGDFCMRWGMRFNSQGSVYDGKRSGRPRKLTGEAAVEAAALLRAPESLRSYPQSGYSSMQDACMRCPRLEEIRLAAGCSYKTMWRAVKRADPQLVARPIRFKPPLSAANRAKRLQHAKSSVRKWRESRQDFQ